MPKLPKQDPSKEYKAANKLTKDELASARGGKFLKGYKEKRKKASG